MGGRLRDVLAYSDDLEGVVWEPYRHDGAGGPPRNPLDILKALVVKRVRAIQSDRQLYRRLWVILSLGNYMCAYLKLQIWIG